MDFERDFFENETEITVKTSELKIDDIVIDIIINSANLNLAFFV